MVFLMSPYLVTPRSLTLCLAYIHYYTPKRLPGHRFLALSALRDLAAWIDQPRPQLRTLRRHPLLMAHLALLYAAGLLVVDEQTLSTGVGVRLWLAQEPADQLAALIHLLEGAAWEEAVERLQWSSILTIDYGAYLCQTLRRQLDALPAAGDEAAVWVEEGADAEAGWLLELPLSTPTWLLFDLLQLGEWRPHAHALRVTPLAVARFPSAAYGFDHLRWLLEMAAQAPLGPARRRQLRAWLARAHAYQVHGPLLVTSQPHYLQAVLAAKRLRPYVYQQLTPRHALIHCALVPRLRLWLEKRGYPLNQHPDAPELETEEVASDAASFWLGLRLLHGLQAHLRLPFLPPTEPLFRLEQTLSPATIAQLERFAAQALRDLDEVIEGRDAFFPAYQCPAPGLVAAVEEAISRRASLTIDYQAHSQPEAKRHPIEPLWLEQRNGLYYLHAYSLRAEANRTFRLDRIVALEAVDG